MDNIDGILIYDEVAFMRHRIGSLFQDYDIQIFEAGYDIEVYKIFADDSINIRLVLMDLGSDVAKGFEVLTLIKERKPNLPIIVVTSNNKRQIFLRCISEGITDYILKPFEDEYLVDKVLSVLKQSRQEEAAPANFIFDIHSYLKTEMKKAIKGKYYLTLIMCTIFDVNDEGNAALDRRYIQTVNSFYELARRAMWDTDIFERYGSQTFIGVFPYCSEGDSVKVIAKLNSTFLTVLDENIDNSPLRIASAVLTGPSEVADPRQLLLSLAVKLDNRFDQIKKKDNVKE